VARRAAGRDRGGERRADRRGARHPHADAPIGAGEGVGFVVTGLAVAQVASGRPAVPGRDDKWFEMSNELLVEAILDGYFTRLAPGWEEVVGWTRAEAQPDERPDLRLTMP
jgi:hypothetical protein